MSFAVLFIILNSLLLPSTFCRSVKTFNFCIVIKPKELSIMSCEFPLGINKVSIYLYSFHLQVAVKNNIDVFYFSCIYPISILFVEEGRMERQVFLATWKDIPNENEAQFHIKDCHLNSDAASNKLQNNNIFSIAKRNVDGQEMLYQSMRLTNGIWVLAELRMQASSPSYMLSLKCRAPEVSQFVFQSYESILKN
uniref:Beta-adaptin appendage C-terminal subdomain domain-containing protein n=1 Tax=Erpetoichthys calabaricus TaxID=27687 RepID=A0A8C4XDB0_ERPCA